MRSDLIGMTTRTSKYRLSFWTHKQSFQLCVVTGQSRAFAFSQLQPLNLSLRFGAALALVIAGNGRDRELHQRTFGAGDARGNEPIYDFISIGARFFVVLRFLGYLALAVAIFWGLLGLPIRKWVKKSFAGTLAQPTSHATPGKRVAD